MQGIIGEGECAHNDCICTSQSSLFTICTFEPRRLERGTASVRHRRVQRMPSNGSLARCASRIKLGSNVSDKKKRVVETLDNVR